MTIEQALCEALDLLGRCVDATPIGTLPADFDDTYDRLHGALHG